MDPNEPEGEEVFTVDTEALTKGMQKVMDDAGGIFRDGAQALFDAVCIQNMTLKDIVGLQDEQVEGLYGQAYRLFNNGQYDQAKNLFRLLTALNFHEPKYPLGRAACLHMEKK